MGTYLYIIRFAKGNVSRFAASLTILTIAVAFGIIPFLIFAKLLMAIMAGAALTSATLVKACLAVGAAFIAKNIFYGMGLDLSHHVAYYSLAAMREKMSDKLLRLSLGRIEDEGRGSLKKIFVEGIEDMELILAHGVPEGFSNTLGTFAILIALFVVDWRLALLMIAVIFVGMIAMAGMMKMGMAYMGDYYAAAARMNDTLIDYINGMEVVKVFNRGGMSFDKYRETVDGYRDYTFVWTMKCLPGMAAYTITFTTPLLFILPVGSWLYLQGSLELNSFILGSLLAMAGGPSLARMVQFFPIVPMIGEKSRRILTFLEQEELKETPQPAAVPQSFDVCFDHVSFRYDAEAADDTIHDISFSAPAGSITAFIGESGSGKSTLMKLLLRFWDYDSGRITIGGTPIDELAIDDLMSLISYVSQDVFLFNMTIRENLLIGCPDADDATLWQALEAANAADFVRHLPEGLDARCGQGGARLSGGEMQRIGIARALLKDAPIIILDEATSATDPENEELIQAALNRLIVGKTVFVIAHRLHTITHADRIILLKDGRIDAIGSHEELLDNRKDYRRMWTLNEQSRSWQIGGPQHA